VSTAPSTLIDLRRFLAEQFEVDRKNFGITGRVTARRPWGFHLGKSDIYSDAGMGDRDYSVRNKRNKAGLTNASAGFDIKVPVGKLKKLTAYLVEKARSDTTNPGGPSLLFEVIGPDANGAAKRWAVPNGWQPEAARADHEWHDHLSFWRDTEFIDKRPLFYDFFGVQPSPPPEEPPVDIDQVKAVQQAINELGWDPPLLVDGIYGPITTAAVQAVAEKVQAEQAELNAALNTSEDKRKLMGGKGAEIAKLGEEPV
jgi:hypothetical protein